MKNEHFGLYIVETEKYQLIENGAKTIKTDYRILASSVTQAAEIVEAGFMEEQPEVVVRSEYISHITILPTNKYKTVLIENEK